MKIKTLKQAIRFICKKRKFKLLTEKLFCPIHKKVHKYNFGTYKGIDIDFESPLHAGFDMSKEVIAYANGIKYAND